MTKYHVTVDIQCDDIMKITELFYRSGLNCSDILIQEFSEDYLKKEHTGIKDKITDSDRPMNYQNTTSRRKYKQKLLVWNKTACEVSVERLHRFFEESRLFGVVLSPDTELNIIEYLLKDYLSDVRFSGISPLHVTLCRPYLERRKFLLRIVGRSHQHPSKNTRLS